MMLHIRYDMLLLV